MLELLNSPTGSKALKLPGDGVGSKRGKAHFIKGDRTPKEGKERSSLGITSQD